MSRASLVLALAGLAASACAETTYPPSPRRPPNPGCHAVAPPAPHERWRLVRAFEGALEGSQARAATHLVPHPTEASVFFLTVQGGRVLRVDAEEARVVYDVAPRADFSFGENGLVSIALSPRFVEDGHAYLVYSAPSETAAFLSRLARVTWDGAAFGDERTILDVDQHAGTHSGNHVAFGQDGLLYYSLGDDRRTEANASPLNLPGSVLRLDVGGAEPYAIPEDNPFADGLRAAPETYAYGFRNPWRFLFEADGTLLLGDVGQDSREEIDVVVRGGDHGWPTREGTLCFQAEPPCGDASLIDPAVEVTHADARSIVPGYRFEGRTTFADFNSGTVFSFDEAAPTDVRVEIEGRFPIVSFGQGTDGTIYALRYDPSGDEGGVYRLERAPPSPPSTFPRLLSETGCVSPADPRAPAEGLFAFAPEAELYSDGAEKTRWLAIPDDARITVAEDGDLVLPVGAVVAKHFGFGGRLHETRLLMRTEEGWSGYSYRWNEAQTDAELLDAGLVEELSEAPVRWVRWSYPRRSQCAECHTPAAGHTLGLEVAQLDDAELGALLEQDFLSPGLDLPGLRARGPLLASPRGDGAVAPRARAYLHANCAPCHRPEGPGGGDMDLRATTPFGSMGICDVEPGARLWDVGVWEEQRLFAPGFPERSTIALRVGTLGVFRMPPLGTGVIDEEGAALLAAWIDATEGCE